MEALDRFAKPGISLFKGWIRR